MRFMMIVKANKDSEAGILPKRELVEAMGRFNEEMARAGVLLAAEGLHPSSKGTRIRFSGEQRAVIDGPFPDSRDLIAGFWLIQVKSKGEAIEWARRCPHPHGAGEAEIELRQVFEAADFPAEVLPPEEAAREEQLRRKIQSKAARS